MIDKFDSLADQIRKGQSVLASKIASIKASKSVPLFPLTKTPLSVSVAAVDGGIISYRMHGFDLAIVRSVGVTFKYANGSLESYSYVPSKYAAPDFDARSALDEHEAATFKSLIRLKSELSVAIQTLEKFKPSLLLLDGSLIPVPSDRPPSDSSLSKDYLEVLSLYQKLYDRCRSISCIPCGIIKDSRSRKLSASFDLECSDGVMCDYLLDEGFRTDIFPYSEKNTLPKELSEVAKSLSFFYLKPAKEDLALRVEFFSDLSPISDLASIIYSLCSISDRFAYPAVLIEADMCASIDPKEIAHLENRFKMLDLKSLRRNNRPFR
ncbi:DNA double-strand break repair nuclease NurA [Candidatus Micrarchaeota archaeon]|nr:DNA double-strand break repair nuclease NurA [Candidatus Micrarchaeota archaeon]